MSDRPDGKKKAGCLRIFVIFGRAMAMIMILMMVIGLIALWRFPSIANDNAVDLTDLLLRCIDRHTLDPLHYLQDDRPLAAIDPKFPAEASGIVTTQRGPYQYDHTIQSSSGSKTSGTTISTTTPHTKIPPDELALARRTLETIYPPTDLEARRQLQSWGKTLFVIWWHSLKDKPKAVIEPVDGTEEEQLWFVWKRLEADVPQSRTELTRLSELLEKTFSDDKEKQAALKWATEFYDNLNRIPQFGVGEFDSKMKEARKRLTNPICLPPKTDWTLAWLLYTHLGLSSESKKEVMDRWWSAFRPDRPDIVLAWAGLIRKEREQKGEALPMGGDDVTLLCGVQRLSGTDAYGIHCREVYWKAMDNGKSDPFLLQSTIIFGCFPNDDLYYVSASGDSLEVVWELSDMGARLGRLMLYFFFMWGVNGWVFNLVGNRILKLGDDERYINFRDRRKLSAVPPIVFIAYALTPLLGWGLALFSMPLWIQALISPARLLVEVYVSVLMGGIVFIFLSQIVAVLLIRYGIDPEKTCLDEIITIPIGVFILMHFGNDILSIISFVALSVIPEFILRFHKGDESQAPSKKTRYLITFGIIALFIGVALGSEKRRLAKKVKTTSASPSRVIAESASSPVLASTGREFPSTTPALSSAEAARLLPPSSTASPSRET